jgi:hypothetical protein
VRRRHFVFLNSLLVQSILLFTLLSPRGFFPIIPPRLWLPLLLLDQIFPDPLHFRLHLFFFVLVGHHLGFWGFLVKNLECGEV